jgi:hypothetical protein
MSYSYDHYGWYSEAVIAGRQTDSSPPAHGPKTVGQPFPNWTGVEWVMAVYAEPPAPVPVPTQRILTKLEYMNRFTDAELAGIYTAAKTVVAVEIWLEKFKLASEINLDDPITIAGLQAMEAATLLATGRSQEILA